MQSWKDLWRDEAGAVLSAEVVLVGSVAVLGAVVGLNTAATAVDEELKEFAAAIRSLDQSYGYAGHQSCRAWSAGSYYRQPDVEQSLSELCGESPANFEAIQRAVDEQRGTRPADATSVLPIAPLPDPVPENQLPKPER
jgi:hypothetical protein